MTAQQLIRARQMRKQGYTMEGAARALNVDANELRILLDARVKAVYRERKQKEKPRTTYTPPGIYMGEDGELFSVEGDVLEEEEDVDLSIGENVASLLKISDFSHTLTHAENSNEKAGAEIVTKRPRRPSLPSWPKDKTTILGFVERGTPLHVVVANFPMTPLEQSNIRKYLEALDQWQSNERQRLN